MTIRGWTVHAPAVDTAAIATTTAQGNGKHRLADVLFSYDAAPTAGSLLISDGTTDILVAITDAGPGRIPSHFLPIESTDQITVTLAAAGGAVTGTLNIRNAEQSPNLLGG